MTIYETIKVAISVKQAAEHYGLKVNRNGMACCPFHNDRHPSMKLNEDCTAESPQLQRRHDCQCREIQSGTLQQHHQLCRTAGVGIYGCGSCGKTSYKWVLRCFVMYVRTGGMAGLILPVMLCTYVRSIYPCFLPLQETTAFRDNLFSGIENQWQWKQQSF